MLFTHLAGILAGIALVAECTLGQSLDTPLRLEIERAEAYPKGANVTLTLVNTSPQRFSYFGTHPSKRQPLQQTRVGTVWMTPPIYALAGGRTYFIEPYERIEVKAIVNNYDNGKILRLGVILGDYEPIVWSDPFVYEQPWLELPLARQVGEPHRPSREELEVRVGRHAEMHTGQWGPTSWLYVVRGVSPFSVVYDERAKIASFVIGTRMSRYTVLNEVLEALAPKRARGRLLNIRRLETTASCYEAVEYTYELITLRYRRDACGKDHDVMWTGNWRTATDTQAPPN